MNAREALRDNQVRALRQERGSRGRGGRLTWQEHGSLVWRERVGPSSRGALAISAQQTRWRPGKRDLAANPPTQAHRNARRSPDRCRRRSRRGARVAGLNGSARLKPGLGQHRPPTRSEAARVSQLVNTAAVTLGRGHSHCAVVAVSPWVNPQPAGSPREPPVQLTSRTTHVRKAHSGETGPRSRAAATAVTMSAKGGTPDSPAGVA
jgi:hypothetical protein